MLKRTIAHHLSAPLLVAALVVASMALLVPPSAGSGPLWRKAPAAPAALSMTECDCGPSLDPNG